MRRGRGGRERERERDQDKSVQGCQCEHFSSRAVLIPSRHAVLLRIVCVSGWVGTCVRVYACGWVGTCIHTLFHYLKKKIHAHSIPSRRASAHCCTSNAAHQHTQRHTHSLSLSLSPSLSLSLTHTLTHTHTRNPRLAAPNRTLTPLLL